MLVKYVALLAGLLVVVAFGVRPALRGAPVRPGWEKEMAKGSSRSCRHCRDGRARGALKPPEPVEIDPERIGTQEIFEQVTAHLKREPTQSSRLLQSWIHSD